MGVKQPTLKGASVYVSAAQFPILPLTNEKLFAARVIVNGRMAINKMTFGLFDC